MKETIYCPMCEEERPFRRETVSEEYDVRGEKIVLEIPRLFCSDCGESIVDEAFGDPTQHLYAEYRRRHNLLTPEQIRGIREKYNLSQESFATLLGTSPATLARYEGGSIQDKAYDQLLRACETPAFMADLMRREGHRLSKRQSSDLQGALSLAIAERAAEGLLRFWRRTIESEKSETHQPPLPQIAEFIKRTDHFAQLPETRRADLFFVVAIATADRENPVEQFLRYRCLSAFGYERPTQPQGTFWQKMAAISPPLPVALDLRLNDPMVLAHNWPRPSEMRLIRRLAVHFEGLKDDEVHHSIVHLASKRLLRNRHWLTMIGYQDLMGSFVFSSESQPSEPHPTSPVARRYEVEDLRPRR